MKRALISPGERRYDNDGNEGARVAAVVDIDFPVADPLYWTDCPDGCVQDKWVYVNDSFVEVIDSQSDDSEPDPPIDNLVVI